METCFWNTMDLGVSKNSGTPKSSILIGFSIIFTIHFGVPLLLETSIWIWKEMSFPDPLVAGVLRRSCESCESRRRLETRLLYGKATKAPSNPRNPATNRAKSIPFVRLCISSWGLTLTCLQITLNKMKPVCLNRAKYQGNLLSSMRSSIGSKSLPLQKWPCLSPFYSCLVAPLPSIRILLELLERCR